LVALALLATSTGLRARSTIRRRNAGRRRGPQRESARVLWDVAMLVAFALFAREIAAERHRPVVA
jgi:hypothetical protein